MTTPSTLHRYLIVRSKVIYSSSTFGPKVLELFTIMIQVKQEIIGDVESMFDIGCQTNLILVSSVQKLGLETTTSKPIISRLAPWGCGDKYWLMMPYMLYHHKPIHWQGDVQSGIAWHLWSHFLVAPTFGIEMFTFVVNSKKVLTPEGWKKVPCHLRSDWFDRWLDNRGLNKKDGDHLLKAHDSNFYIEIKMFLQQDKMEEKQKGAVVRLQPRELKKEKQNPWVDGEWWWEPCQEGTKREYGWAWRH